MTPTEWDQEHARLTAALQALGERPEKKYLTQGHHTVTYSNGYEICVEGTDYVWRYTQATDIPAVLIVHDDATLTALLALNPESEVARLRARVQELEGQVVAEKEDHAFTQSRFEAAHKTFFTVFDALSLVKPTYFDTPEPSGIRRCFDALDSIVTERDTLRTELDARVIAHNELFDQLQRTTAELDAIKAQEPWKWAVRNKATGIIALVDNPSQYLETSWEKFSVYRRPVAEARDVEAAAKRIYAVMVAHDTTGMACAWQEGGNSLMQDNARRYARAAVAEARDA